MQPRTKKLLGLLTRPGIDELIVLLSHGPIDETTVEDRLQVSQSTANRNLRDLETWGLASAEVKHDSTAGKRGPKRRIWRLAMPQAVAFMDRADAFTSDVLQAQLDDAQAASNDARRRTRVKDAAA